MVCIMVCRFNCDIIYHLQHLLYKLYKNTNSLQNVKQYHVNNRHIYLFQNGVPSVEFLPSLRRWMSPNWMTTSVDFMQKPALKMAICIAAYPYWVYDQQLSYNLIILRLTKVFPFQKDQILNPLCGHGSLFSNGNKTASRVLLDNNIKQYDV